MKTDLKISAIVEARIESKRLPCKILLPINNIPIIQLLINRISFSKYIDQIIVASPDSPYSTLIHKSLDPHPEIFFYRGAMDDVLDRVLQAAIKTKTDIIVSITADCPFVDPRHIDYLIYILANSQNKTSPIDYVSNVVKRTWPDGFDIQVFTTKALEKINKMTVTPNYRQHSGWNILNHQNSFNIFGTTAPEEFNHPEIGLTLDTLEDYLLIYKIYEHFHFDNMMSAEDIINYILKNKELLLINEKVRRKTPGEG